MTLRRPAFALSVTLLCVALDAVEEPTVPSTHPTVPAWADDAASVASPTYTVSEHDMTIRGGAQNMVDWLREIPATRVFNTGGGVDGGNADVRQRGMPGIYTQILIDGIPVNDPSSATGDMNPSVVNPSGIDHIVVRQGPQSATYGSRAMAGTVNIHTLRPTDTPHESVAFGVGRDRLFRFAVQASGPIDEKTGYAVSGETFSSSGFSAQTAELNADPSPHENDAVRRVSAGLRIERQVSQNAEIYGALTVIRVGQQLDEIDPDDTLARRRTRIFRFAGGGSTRLTATTTAIFDVAFTDSLQLLDTSYGPASVTPYPLVGPSTYDPTIRESHSSERFARLIFVTDQPSDYRLSGGLDGHYDVAGQGFDGLAPEWESSEHILGLFADGRWMLKQFNIEANGRVDQYEHFGSLMAGRLSGAWTPTGTDWLTAHATLSTGFRAPSLYEFSGYHRVGDFGFGPVYYIGNSHLRPEQVTNIELGATARPEKNLELSADLFHWFFTDKIEYNYYVTPNTYDNIPGHSYVTGLETRLAAKNISDSDIDIDASYTTMKSSDGVGSSLPFVPREIFDLRVTAHQNADKSQRSWTSLGISYTGFYYGLDQDKGYLPGYIILQASAGITIDDTWDIILRIDNLLNKHYEQTAPFDLDGDTIPDHTNSSRPRTYELTFRGRF